MSKKPTYYCYTLIMIRQKKNIIITGTHLTPALELIRQLQSDPKTDWQISYIGRRSNSNDINDTSIESKIIPDLGIKFYPIYCGKLDRRYLPNTIIGIPKTVYGFFQAHRLIKKIKPEIVVSFGGYVSVPVIINAKSKNIKTITHEQTLTNSFTTKINSWFVDKIALSFKNERQMKQLPASKIVITGNLLRFQLFQPHLKRPQNINFKQNHLPLIYITAGNQGSHSINLCLKSTMSLLTNYNIIHQTGKNDFPLFKKMNQSNSNYFASDYFTTTDFAWIINSADIIIGRSGANTSQEIVAFSKKSILIPLPQSQQDEQLLNALWVKKELNRQTVIINQTDLNPKSLFMAITSLSQVSTSTTKTKITPNLKLLKLIYEII